MSADAELDAIDRRIIHCLIDDATLSNNELAERVGLTPAPLSRRLARLYAEGVIRKTLAVNPAAIGIGLQAFVEVTLDRTGPNVAERFFELVRRTPEVIECHTVAGTFDFLLKVAVRDVAAYKELLWTEFEHMPEIKTLRSLIILDTPKEARGPMP
jgi:Lrp/AsnC family transcriptional regulator, leucine-responsive regulatory protein